MKRLLIVVSALFVLGIGVRLRVAPPRPAQGGAALAQAAAAAPLMSLELRYEGEALAGGAQSCSCPTTKCAHGTSSGCRTSCTGKAPVCNCASCKPNGGLTNNNTCHC